MGTRGWLIVGLGLTLFLGLTTDQILTNVYDSSNTALRVNAVAGGSGTPLPTSTPLVFGTPGVLVAYAATELGSYPGAACTPPALALSTSASGVWTCATPVAAASTNKSVLAAGWTGSTAANSSFFVGLGAGQQIGNPDTGNGSSPASAVLIPGNGTLKNLHCRMANNLTGGTLDFSVGDRLPGGDINATTVTCQMTSGTHTCEDTAHSVSVTPGSGASTNVFTLKLVTSSGFTIGGNGGYCSAEFDAT